MSILVTDAGFGPDGWAAGFDGADKSGRSALDVGPDTDLERLVGIFPDLGMIRIDFPGFADGRGGICWPINMPWPGVAALTRSRSTMTWPPANPRDNGWRGPTGAPMIIRRGCAGHQQPEHQEHIVRK